jgi:hypothetical protein
VDQVKKFTTNELIILAGCLLVFIGWFMKWFKVDNEFIDISVKGSHYFFQGTIPWLLSIALAAVIIIRKLAPNVKLPDLPLPWNQVYLIAAAVSAVLILTRIITTDGDSSFVDRGLGIFIAFIGGIAQVVGAALKFTSKEGDAPSASSSTPPTPF